MKTMRWMGWLGMAALALLLATGAAQAQLAKSGKFSGTKADHHQGQAFESGDGRWYAIGVGHGVFINSAGNGFLHNVSITCPWAVDINQGKMTGAGPCVTTDADGDRVFMEWRGVRPKPDDWFAGDMDFTGGTGKYKGITGKVTWKSRTVAMRNNGSESEAITLWEGEYRLP
jgi:hypothetical protein